MTARARAASRAGDPPGSALICTIVPSAVHCSADDHHKSIVELILTIENPSEAPVESRGLRVTLPEGGERVSGALTSDPSTIAAAVGKTTPWAIARSGENQFYAVPLPPATGLDPRSTIELKFRDVVVNLVTGDVEVAVEDALDQPVGKPVVRKLPAELAPAAVAPTASLAADRVEVGVGHGVTLTWEAAEATSCQLEREWTDDDGTTRRSGPVPLPDPAKGHLPVAVDATTTFLLRALGPGGTAHASVVVAVVPVRIDSFAANPAHVVALGAPVTLSWHAEFASQVSVDQGIGIVSADGSCVVEPERTTTYTLSAWGLEPQHAAVTVEVQEP